MTTNGDALIRVRDLEKVYGKGLIRKKGFKALDGVSLEVERGRVFGLLGPNGAGKTTFIKVLLGLVGGWRGDAELFGRPIGSATNRRGIGYLPEAHRLPGYLTGRQVLSLYGMYSGRSSDWLDQRIPRWLDLVGMTGDADRKVKTYSKGMQQRIGLAQALVHEPELIFLDEPTDGVDPVGRAAIRRIVSRLRDDGVTIFLNSHLLMEVEKVCDRVVIMDKGRIVREGTIEELTPGTGRIAFDLDPVPDDLERLLDGLGGGFEALPTGFELSLETDDQDRVVDRLRQRGVSIRSMAPRKLTLEDAFIELVSDEREGL